MIERFYLKNYLSFLEVELNLKKGLIVFSGPSGSGKSILLNAILSSVGLSSCEANICESSVTWKLDTKKTGIENDDINVFKQIKKEKTRYFINSQTLSKKSISAIASTYLRHLSLKDFSDFKNENLLEILDNQIVKKDKTFKVKKSDYKELFEEFLLLKLELQKIKDEQKKIVELKEFTAFEIKKIADINPSINEDEELLEIKKELSKKEKVLENIAKASEIFNYEYYVSNALDSLDIDSSFFYDAMNELRATLDTAQDRFSSLDEVDIEEVLTRLEELSRLKRRYGSIEEALEYKKQKEIELQHYENIEFKKDELEKKFNQLKERLIKLADEITSLRKEQLVSFETELNGYLKNLYLRDAKVILEDVEFNKLGANSLKIELNQTELSNISTGEFNRLRLAILALKSDYLNTDGGVLMLDEIDANLSGEESMSVAKVLQKLSKHFQIFVISHQPQLTSMGDQHFLIYKESGISKVKELDFNKRVDEIARIISGEKISNEAKKFAKELLEAKNAKLT